MQKGWFNMSVNNEAFFRISYGLYIVTCKDGEKDNGLIINTVTQVTNAPNRIAVTINKENYSHDIIKNTGLMNVCCLNENTPFSVIENFGFKSGKNSNKFEGLAYWRSQNGLGVLKDNINSFFSLKTEQYIDLGTHGMFICSVELSETITDEEPLTYSYYHKHIKPKPDIKASKGYICKICGYVYEGEPLPEDFICPLCKHPASDFEKIV